MKGNLYVVNNRVFLLGLDQLYRERTKEHERGELLRCARETAKILSVAPADVPIEGYYSEDQQLTAYFRLMRALQEVPKSRESEVASAPGFIRLLQVTGSPIFGPSADEPKLLPAGRDVLTAALLDTFPSWTVDNVLDKAYEYAIDSDDFSLVALAALTRDAVIATVLRESVVLYSELAVGEELHPSEPEYVWEVDEVIQDRAVPFVETFNELFSDDLPMPKSENAASFWTAAENKNIIGRCVRIGSDDQTVPIMHYHWAIDWSSRDAYKVRDFWDTGIWTTDRYRAQRHS